MNSTHKNVGEDVLPDISLIMPVYNGVDMIRKSLPPLLAMKGRREILEVTVVDDGSTDETVSVARSMGANVITSGGRLGPGGARNIAAKSAQGNVLWFVDADVVVYEDCARVLQEAFRSGNAVAIFGSYDDKPLATNFLSQYKNLVHHYYHQLSDTNASTFWSGCGAVRRKLFLQLGGFDVGQFKHPSIEDIELGYRIVDAGEKVRLLPELQCTHLKEWRFINLVHTEIFRRAIPWSRLILSREKMETSLNVSVSERIRAVLAGVLLLCITGAVAGAVSFAWPMIVGLITFLLNFKLAEVFFKRKGFFFCVGGLLFHQLYYLYSSAAFAWALLERVWTGRINE